MAITLIAAIADNGAIGSGNKLPWHIPHDLQMFKALTTGHAVVMGRKTFESIGKPLPQRHNIVMTKNRALYQPGIQIATRVYDVLQIDDWHGKHLFVMGGAQIYKLFMPYVQRLVITHVHARPKADAYLDIDFSKWHKEVSRTHEGINYTYTFAEYVPMQNRHPSIR